MVKYILELNADEHEAREMLFDNGIPEVEITEQEIDRTINNLNEMSVDDFYYSLPRLLIRKGYEVGYGAVGYWMVFEYNTSRVVAELHSDYTHDNHLEICVDTSNSQTDLTGGIHEVLLELTTRKLK